MRRSYRTLEKCIVTPPIKEKKLITIITITNIGSLMEKTNNNPTRSISRLIGLFPGASGNCGFLRGKGRLDFEQIKNSCFLCFSATKTKHHHVVHR